MRFFLALMAVVICASGCFEWTGRTSFKSTQDLYNQPLDTPAAVKQAKAVLALDQEYHTSFESELPWLMTVCILGVGASIAAAFFLPSLRVVASVGVAGFGSALGLILLVEAVLPYLKLIGECLMVCLGGGVAFLIYHCWQKDRTIASVSGDLSDTATALKTAAVKTGLIASTVGQSQTLSSELKGVVQNIADTVATEAKKVL